MSVRREALSALSDVVGGAYANLRLQALRARLPEREARFAAALVYETLDRLVYLDFLINAYCAKRPKPALVNLLRLTLCETLFFGTPARAAISEAVNLAKECGLSANAGFVNAVLRRADRERSAPPPLPDDPAERLCVQYSFPRWLVDMWMREYGADTAAALVSCPPKGLQLRAQYPCTTEALLSELPVPCRRGALDADCLLPEAAFDATASAAFTEGRMTIQGESAMLACRAMGDLCNKTVLDVCAAPGGKSAFIASLSENTAKLTCFEKHPHRTALMQKTFSRLHVDAKIETRDAAVPDPALFGRFDAVLVDAPCSGLGLLNDKPDIRYRKTDADVAALAAVQADILAASAAYVRPGGVLVYATCTISRRENDGVVQAFLQSNARFSPETVPIPVENDGAVQLFPHIHGVDGFFIARLRRCS